MIEFKALVVEEYEIGKFRRSIQNQIIDQIPDNCALIRVEYSSLNYKDALSARGHKGISRFYPHTPGIDAAGYIVECKNGTLANGDAVIVTGYDLGMNTKGGFGQYVVVPTDWIVALPKNLTLKQSMIYGTAGFTAAICVYELMKHDIRPDSGKILVNGATGGVGSMAIGILAHLGYSVTASSGKASHYDYLRKLGASEIISREDVNEISSKPLLSAKWAGVVDNVGGNTLTNIIKSVAQHGCVCILGNVEGDAFSSTVYPFLLRGITLSGIDSASRLMPLRMQLWNNLANDWKFDMLDQTFHEVKLENLSDEIDTILLGGQVGRAVVKLW
jgi:acrylyl-CoA reductase (NADPH)